jgi:spoIIIJ-associated protein
MNDHDQDLDRTLQDLGIGDDAGDVEGPAAPSMEDLDLDNHVVVPGVVPDDLPASERTEIFLVDLLMNVDPAYSVDVYELDDDEIAVEVHGGDAGRLIGKNGRTLAALEQISNAVVNRHEDSHVRVNIDVGGYKRRRDERLTQQAGKVAERVERSGQPAEMDPMTAAERRVVHMALADHPDVVTESAGEGRDRRVVVKPRSDDDHADSDDHADRDRNTESDD